jgi:retron-type reverse transcriptase
VGKVDFLIFMKRHGNLYSKICSMENLSLAHINAKKGKSHYTEVKIVNQNPEKYLSRIRDNLLNQTYKTSAYRTKIVREPKERLIYVLPYYPDRIVHHAIMQVIQPIWDRVFIRDLYSSIPGKGLHKASYRLRGFLADRINTKYCLKFDVSKFYPSIRHDILYNLIQHKIKCKDTLWLLHEIIESLPGERNVPIGNYLSQYFGNIYLNEFDHWLKEEVGIRYYMRYCDDGVLLDRDKDYLNAVLRDITYYMKEKLDLSLNNKTQLFPVDSRGIDFLGYRTFRNYTLLRKSAARRFKSQIRLIESGRRGLDPETVVSSIMSHYGWIKHCDGWNLINDQVLQNDRLRDIMDRNCKVLGCRNPLDRLTR